MGGRGGCCVAGCGVSDNSYDHIMLRFRPIAPKPAAAAGGGGGCSSSSDGSKDSQARRTRGRRSRYVRNNSTRHSDSATATNRKAITRSSRPESGEIRSTRTTSDKVTLPLFPPAHDHGAGSNFGVALAPAPAPASDVTEEAEDLNFMDGVSGNHDLTPGLGPNPGRSAHNTKGSIGVMVTVTVESVTDAWGDGNQLGRTDEERVMNLGRDTCPGFISDGEGRVRCLNEAFRKMATSEEGGGGREEEIAGVWLVMGEDVGAAVGRGWTCKAKAKAKAFTCRVRVVCRRGRDEKMSSVTSPCDVWRMDGGDFAWRLDVEAALRLGR